MKILFKDPKDGKKLGAKKLIIIVAETTEGKELLSLWDSELDEHVFLLIKQNDNSIRLEGLGPRPDACREPINVVYSSPDIDIQLISNLAHTAFTLDGKYYASVESFWQGLKFPSEKDRRRIAHLYGKDAKRAGQGAPEAETFVYNDAVIRFGSQEHQRLMAKACLAKFTQHQEAKNALLKTRDRPLMHKPRRDSKTIPGVIMADIWMKIRSRLSETKE